MGDIEETLFKRNIPGKYSTWDVEDRDFHSSSIKKQTHYDDDDHDDDHDDDNDQQYDCSNDIQQDNSRRQEFEDLSDLPIPVRDHILSERSRRHATGVKVISSLYARV